jgi:DNA-binding NtrC family response regulator
VPLSAEIQKNGHAHPAATGVDVEKKTILIYSPDLNFSFSLSMVFQDRYNVVTTSNPTMLESFASTYSADIAIVDAVPSEKLIRQIDGLKVLRGRLPVIVTYVYDARDVGLDNAIRAHVDAVLYKPFEVDAVLSQVEQLLFE